MNKPWKEIVAKAELYRELGQTEHYLDSGHNDYPWAHVTSCEPGGTHRIDISTSVYFHADSLPSGMKFRWSFDLEPRSANGSGHYHIDIDAIRNVLSLLPPSAADSFRKYLAACAVAVQASADKYLAVAGSEAATAQALRQI